MVCPADAASDFSNVAELLAERGLLSIIRHRQGDEQRSSDYDKLMAAEAKAIAELKGVHSGKDFPLGRIIDASEVGLSTFVDFSKLTLCDRRPLRRLHRSSQASSAPAVCLESSILWHLDLASR